MNGCLRGLTRIEIGTFFKTRMAFDGIVACGHALVPHGLPDRHTISRRCGGFRAFRMSRANVLHAIPRYSWSKRQNATPEVLPGRTACTDGRHDWFFCRLRVKSRPARHRCTIGPCATTVRPIKRPGPHRKSTALSNSSRLILPITIRPSNFPSVR